MKFTLVTALLAGAAVAVPTFPVGAFKPINGTAPINGTEIEPMPLDRRAGAMTAAIVGGAVSGVVAVAIKDAIDTIKAISDWDPAREAFTQATTAAMFQRAKNGEAAVCYNKAYTVSKPNQMRELTSVRFTSGILNTDYDCFFMWGPDNRFTSNGDGGYINLAIMSPPACRFEGKTSDLYCQ